MDIEKLSTREKEIASAYADGASYREIAERFGIAPTTVRTHLGTIYRKLGVRSKIELLRHLSDPSESDATPAATPPNPAFDTERPSIVVLPFENLAGQADHEALISGLVDSVTGTLSRFRLLMVISPASSLAYRNRGKDARSIAEELSARYAVRGGFNRIGDAVRVSAELIDVETGAQIWSKNFDGAWSDIFALQDDLACTIAASIEPEIRVRELDLARRRQTDNMSAWTLYCQAHHAAYEFTTQGYRDAVGLCEQAILADDHFAAPHSMLGRIHFMETILGISDDPRASIGQGIEHSRRAIELDARDEVGYGCLSCNLLMTGAYDEAFLLLERGFQLNPNNAELYNARALAHVFSKDGDFKQVIRDSEHALKLSPNDPMRWTFLTNIGMANLADDREGSVDKALQAFRAATIAPKAGWIPSSGAAMAALAIGDLNEVEKHIARAKSLQPGLNLEDHMQAFGHMMDRSKRMRALYAKLGERF